MSFYSHNYYSFLRCWTWILLLLKCLSRHSSKTTCKNPHLMFEQPLLKPRCVLPGWKNTSWRGKMTKVSNIKRHGCYVHEKHKVRPFTLELCTCCFWTSSDTFFFNRAVWSFGVNRSVCVYRLNLLSAAWEKLKCEFSNSAATVYFYRQ